MNNLMNAFENENTPAQGTGNTLAQAQSSREMEEVKGQIFMAKQFPRNVIKSEQRIMDNCKRPSLASVARYSYPRGGTQVTGPSIRLAETMAQNWGNLAYGVKELEQKNGESVAMAYCWDLETNVRREMVFTVPHTRHTRKGVTKLTDPRDIYELVANNGARRLRACILGVIPGDITELAVLECEKTLSGGNSKPIAERRKGVLQVFKAQFDVTESQLVARIGRNVDAWDEYDLVKLGDIYNSLKDGMSKPEDWFEKPEAKKGASKLEQAMDDKKVEEKKETPQKEDEKPETEDKPKQSLEELNNEPEQGELL